MNTLQRIGEHFATVPALQWFYVALAVFSAVTFIRIARRIR